MRDEGGLAVAEARTQVFTGGSVEEAIASGLAALHLKRDEAEVKVIDRGSKGLFGFLSRPARVSVSGKEEGLAPLIEGLARDVLAHMGVDASIKAAQHGPDVVVRVESEAAGLLIGRKGETLEALQHLVVRMASRRSGARMRNVRVDIGGYRSRRDDQLRDEAVALAERVERSGRRAMTEPLTAPERRVVHRALADRKGVTTHVAGNGNVRRVIILPASSR